VKATERFWAKTIAEGANYSTDDAMNVANGLDSAIEIYDSASAGGLAFKDAAGAEILLEPSRRIHGTPSRM
jgi:hypothetical protein